MIALLLIINSVLAATPTPSPRPISHEAQEAQRALICWWPEKGTPERVQDIINKKIAAGCNR